MLIVMGYSTFIILAIRSNANTPIDENNPEDAMSLLAYYNREQYVIGLYFMEKASMLPMTARSLLVTNPSIKRFLLQWKTQTNYRIQTSKEAEDYLASNDSNLKIEARYLLTDDKKRANQTTTLNTKHFSKDLEWWSTIQAELHQVDGH